VGKAASLANPSSKGMVEGSPGVSPMPDHVGSHILSGQAAPLPIPFRSTLRLCQSGGSHLTRARTLFFGDVELHDMECQTVRSLLVPYLDGELAPAQIDWIDAHCAICDDCRAAAALLSRQSEILAALPPPPMPSQVASALWNQLDADLAPALSQMEAHASPILNAPQAAFRNKVRLSRRTIAGYGALLCLAVAFGLWRHDAAATAEANVQTLRVKLERAERLQASPRPLPARTSGFQTAAYTRGRGHL
jgi:hypothetical protein